MLLSVINAGGKAQTEVVRGQETPVSRSGTLPDADWKLVAEANPTRSGFVLQSQSPATMAVCDPQPDTDPSDADAWTLGPAGYWPPPGYPVTTGPIYVKGEAGASYVAREW